MAVLLLAACGGGDGASVELAAVSAWSGGAGWGVAVVDDGVWVTDPSRGVLVRLPADGGSPTERASGAPDPRDAGLTVSDGRLWVANLGGSVAVYDATTGEPVARTEVGPGEPANVAVGGGLAWVPLHGPGGGLVALDVDTLEVIHRVDLPESAFAAAIAGDTVWVAGLDRRLFAIDTATGDVIKTIDIGRGPRGVAVVGDTVWVTLSGDKEVVRVDTATGDVVARVATDGTPWPIVASRDAVWVAEVEGRLLRIDPDKNRADATAPIPAQARGIAVGQDAVWVATQAGGVSRVSLE